MSNNKKFLIVGLGLIGGSFASALANLGYEVGGLDVDKESIDFALENKFIAHGQTQPLPEYISKFDVVIFALYPKIFVNWLKDNQDYLKSGAIITDCTGVKTSIVNTIQKTLRKDVEFLPAHPMAGRENCGIKHATSQIFNGANYIITPTDKNTKTAIDYLHNLAKDLGFGKVSILSPEEHDEIIGFLSQLTHCIAVSLMNCQMDKDLKSFTGDSFRDLTRIAKINDKMWAELFSLNKNLLVEQIDNFILQLDKLKNYIKTEDELGMREMMRKSTQNRIKFDEK